MAKRIALPTFCLFGLALSACGQSDLSQLEQAGPALKPVPAISQDQKIKIVGSSTVAPFSRTVAERFGAVTRFPSPIVESTGTGGGFKAFCQGVGPLQPSITGASRKIKESETDLCARAGVTAITEIFIGYDGIVIANAKHGPPLDITKQQLFLALAKDIPDGQGGFKPNPYTVWSQIDPSLPNTRISVMGPPPTSGTRDAFVEIGMEKGAAAFPELAALKAQDENAFKERAHTVRTDGVWIDFGENDTAIVQSLIKSPEAYGVLGYSFLEQNGDRVKAAKLGGVEPSFEAISSGDYGLARSMYIYVKDQNVPLIEGLAELLTEFVSDGALGPEGYVLEKGIIPPHPDELEKEQQEVRRIVTSAKAS